MKCKTCICSSCIRGTNIYYSTTALCYGMDPQLTKHPINQYARDITS